MSGSAALAMDRMYRRQRHIYDLTRKYYLLGRDALIRDLAPPPGGSVLEIGCGTGRNLVAAAKRYRAARFLGLDISAEMLATAGKSAARAGLGERISFAQADATAFTSPERFDRVFLSYTLSMIPPWTGAIDRAAAVVAEGGSLHVVDFGQGEGLPVWFRRGLFAWLAKFDVTPRAGLFDALAAVAAREGMTIETRRLHRGYAWGAVLRRG
jgi:S-adenosylmethionine-diacylgycerolhomoserine-N-methlytransferase